MQQKFFSGTGTILICLLLVACKFWLVGPHELVALEAPHDDLLFITLAENIIQGKWLGDYNQLTLIKGPFYPLFIAASYFLDIPLLAAQQLLYAFACFVFIWALFPVIQHRWLLVLIFVFLLFNPFSYNYPAVGRVFRLGIYQSLGLLVFGSLSGLYIRSKISLKNSVGWALLAGLAFSAFWHTREESIWIVPSLFLLFVAAIYANRALGRSRRVVLVSIYLLPVMIWAGATFTLRMLNLNHYGIFATIEVETSAFESAYGGLLRVKSNQWKQYYPVVTDVRKQVYRVSPSFREIEPYLEGEVGKQWMALARTPEIPANFFIWAFRDAVAYAGYYKNGPGTMELYRKIGREIDIACEKGQLDCRPRITSLVPPWHREYNRLFVRGFYNIFQRIVRFQDFSADTGEIRSKGSRLLMQRFSVVTREKLRTSRKGILCRYPDYHNHLNQEKIRILYDIGTFYQFAVPKLFAFFCVVLLLFPLVPALRRRISGYVVLALSCLGGLCSITFILTLVVITSYFSINRAMHVSYPLVLLTIVCMLLAVIDCFSSVEGKEKQ